MNLENLWAWVAAIAAFLSLKARKLKLALRRKKISVSYQDGTGMLQIQETKSLSNQAQEKDD